MTTLREAAQQALEALEFYPVTVNHWKAVLLPAANTLRAALAEPETIKPMHPEMRKMWEDYFDKCFRSGVAPVQEPVPGEYNGWVLREVLFSDGEPVGHREPVQQSPLVKAWVGLTVDEIKETYFTTSADFVDYARAIEARLKEKNT